MVLFIAERINQQKEQASGVVSDPNERFQLLLTSLESKTKRMAARQHMTVVRRDSRTT